MRRLPVVLPILVFLCCSVSAYAQSDPEIAAASFLKFLRSDRQIVSAESINVNEVAPQQPNVIAGYLFHLSGGGYILVSASTSLTPVKAYSLNRPFAALPEPYRKYLLRELEYNIRNLGASTALQPAAVSENQTRWDFLLRFGSLKTPYSYAPGTVLLTTKWNQDYPFNKFLPEINGTTVLAGCVNVAIAQVLKYYNYPASGNGVESYTWNGQQLKAILYRSYNWENMPDVVNSATPAYKADEVALLMGDLGIVNHTSFGLTDSGATMSVNALIENFGLSNAIQRMDNSNVSQFSDTLKNEIDASRPVLLFFPGHMTVADGYTNDFTGRKIHVNMGWGGTADDYYYIDFIPGQNESITAGGYIFPLSLNAYYNVKPCSGADCAPNLETGDTINNLSISGNLNYDRDADRYQVYLKGSTTISASRDWVYSNVGFYIYLYDSSGNAVFSGDGNGNANTQVSAGSLPMGRYTLKASLYDDAGTSYWPYDAGHRQYSVSISSSAVTAGEKAAIDTGLDIGPVISNSFPDLSLNSTVPQPYKILIDARDENGDAVTITATNSNGSAVVVDVSKNILSITPVGGASKVSSKITVTASANGKTAGKSFVAMLLNEDIAFGREFTVSGVFEDQNDVNSHKVVLDGACTVAGYNGYSNQAFFSSVRDSSGQTVVQPDDATINHTFSRGIYSIGVSLGNGSGTYYPYTAGHESYALTISCPSANNSTTVIAQTLGVDLTGALGGSVLALTAGWNFVSTSTTPDNSAIGVVLNDISPKVQAVWGYDNQSKQWLKYVPDAQNPTLTAFESGKGYWIYVDSSANLTVAGSDASPSIHLYAGWNLVGYNGTDSRDVASSLMTIPGKWNVLWTWSGGWSGKHETIYPLPSPIQALILMHRGKAYWIKVRETADWIQ